MMDSEKPRDGAPSAASSGIMSTPTTRLQNRVDDEDWEIISGEEVASMQVDPWVTRNTYYCRSELSLTFKNTEDPTGAVKQSALGPGTDEKLNWQTQSIFFRLPATIRQQIYEKVFLLKTTYPRLRQTEHGKDCPPSVLALLETCRRISSEAECLFYKLNHFVLRGYDLRNGLLRVLSPDRRNAFRSITISVKSASETLLMLKELQLAPNLENLYIERLIAMRFTNIRDWVVLGMQLKAEIGKFRRLRVLKTVYTSGNPPSQEEPPGADRLQSVDRMLAENLGGQMKLEA